VTAPRRPPRLCPGDRLAAVTLSWGGPGTHPERYQAGKRQLERAFGVEVVEMPHTLDPPAEVDAHPEARAADLMAAFADPAIHGIVSTIGGDDSIRLLPYLDLDVIRANPKVFLGYSDTTVTHFACRKAGLVSFYGPSIMAGFAENGGLFPYMEHSVRRSLFETAPVGVVEPNREGWTAEMLPWSEPANQQRRRSLVPCTPWRFVQGRGRAVGRLLGGCLESLDFLRGTALWPDPEEWQGALLFVETSEEAPPPELLARTLRTWAAMGILSRLGGLLLGRPGGSVDPETFADYDEAVVKVFSRELGLGDLPVVTNMDFGHTDPMFVLPLGVSACIDCDAGTFAILESGVVDREAK